MLALGLNGSINVKTKQHDARSDYENLALLLINISLFYALPASFKNFLPHIIDYFCVLQRPCLDCFSVVITLVL